MQDTLLIRHITINSQEILLARPLKRQLGRVARRRHHLVALGETFLHQLVAETRRRAGDEEDFGRHDRCCMGGVAD